MSLDTPILSHSPEETKQTGFEWAKGLKAGDVVCFRGDLGAGKTHFIKGACSFFGYPENEVSSPTFTIINEYPAETPLYHFDCYRLQSPEEILEIGGEDYFYGEGICFIEWPERIEDYLPSTHWEITIEHVDENTRQIAFRFVQ